MFCLLVPASTEMLVGLAEMVDGSGSGTGFGHPIITILKLTTSKSFKDVKSFFIIKNLISSIIDNLYSFSNMV